MSELRSVLDMIELDEKEPVEEGSAVPTSPVSSEELHPFDVNIFADELYEKFRTETSKKLNRTYQNITGYSIAHNCIQETLFRLRHTPVECTPNSWLPIFLRRELGCAVHSFLETNTQQFTETEINLKVPSIRFYGKIDFLCGQTILGEIKSCNYNDYRRVIRTQSPRPDDYLQAMTYLYVLEKHLPEIREQKETLHPNAGEVPKYESYNIQKLQFLYVAHDICAADVESYCELQDIVKNTKKLLNSKKNQFYFITSLIIDLDEEAKKECFDWIEEKFKAIFYYLENMRDPEPTNKFVKSSECFFCVYNQICPHQKYFAEQRLSRKSATS